MKSKYKRIKESCAKRIKRNKKAFIIYTILRALIILMLIRCILQGNYESAALCILSLILFMIPVFLEESFHIEIPPMFQISIYMFIYAAEILGEINNFYTKIPGWDTMLHTINGFLCAAVGLSLVDLLNKSSRKIKLSPLYLAVAAFCFSMTIGVLWEFFEFFNDVLFCVDMQKDFIVPYFGSVKLDPTNSQIPIRVSNIARTIIETNDGASYIINGGYLDIGIVDTMKDLFVNFIGAVTFSIIGYIHEKKRPAKSITDDFRVKRERKIDFEAYEDLNGDGEIDDFNDLNDKL